MSELFNNEDMEIIGSAIQVAYVSVLDQYGESNRTEIIQFVFNLITKEKPFTWTTAEGLKHIKDVVFGTELYYDFVFSLQFHFLARWGEGTSKYSQLANVLAQAISQENQDPELSLIPKELRDRLSDNEDALAIISNNRWLVTILVLKLFVTIEIPMPIKRKETVNETQ